MSEMRLKDKIAVVTGSSRGIGKAVAKTFAREGANVVINYRTGADEAGKVVNEIKAMGREAIAVQADVSEKSQAKTLIHEAIREFGRLHILVNNAGIAIPGNILGTKEEDWNRTMAVNLTGPFNCMQAAAREMVKHRNGKIINVSSVAGIGISSPPSIVAYSCSKAGLISLTKSVAIDLGPHGIQVNCVAPGFTATEMAIEIAGGEEGFNDLRRIKSEHAVLGRIGEPKDIAEAVLFLASADSDFITGQVLIVDGGRKDSLVHA